MAFCSKCGGQVNEGARFCYHCGAPIENPGQPTQPQQSSGQYVQGQASASQPQQGAGQYGQGQPMGGPQGIPGSGQYGQGQPMGGPQGIPGSGQYGQGQPMGGPQGIPGSGQYGQGQPMGGPQGMPGNGQYSQTQQQFGQQQSTGQSDFTSRVASLNNTADRTGEFDPQDIQSNKAMAILAYFGILVLIPLFAAKESRFARFHANQGLILCIAEVAYGILYGVMSAVILAISWRLYFLVTLIGLVGLVFLVFMILGIINAAEGKAKELPVIGKFKILN